MGRMEVSVRQINRAVGKQLGQLGKEEVLRQAKVVFGADRKFSGAKHSRNARRAAGVSSYKITTDGVTIYPSGDPWYIMVLGRGRSNIKPVLKGRHAVRTPRGLFSHVHGGRMRARPAVLDPIVTAIGEKGPEIIVGALVEMLDEL